MPDDNGNSKLFATVPNNEGDQYSLNFSDPSNFYANNGGNWISFTYIFGGKNTEVKFKAFITDYQDDFKIDWNSEKVYGRADPIMTYKNTARNLSVSWDVPSAGLADARQNLKRAAQLMRFCYPAYEDQGNASTISKPPLLRVRFKNFAKNASSNGLIGAVQGFAFKPVIDDGFWDPPGADGLIPKTLQFSCEMTVLHENPIGWKISSLKKDRKGVNIQGSQVASWGGGSNFPFLSSGDGGVSDVGEIENAEKMGNAWVTYFDGLQKDTVDYWENQGHCSSKDWGEEISQAAKADFAAGFSTGEICYIANRDEKERRIQALQSLDGGTSARLTMINLRSTRVPERKS
jgi:hypothetical protein